jgi:hypothetical protein
VLGVDVGVSLIEISCNWRSVKNLRTTKDSVFPCAEALESQGVTICEQPTSVLIPFHERDDINIIEMRDWLMANSRKRFVMFNRFRFETYKYRIDRAYLGVNFRFTQPEDAFLFKLFYY